MDFNTLPAWATHVTQSADGWWWAWPCKPEWAGIYYNTHEDITAIRIGHTKPLSIPLVERIIDLSQLMEDSDGDCWNGRP